VAVGIAYLVTMAVQLPALVSIAFHDSDVAVAPVLGEYVGRGLPNGAAVILGHYGWYTTLWYELLTRSLPFHRQLWEGFGPMLAVGSALVIGAVAWRLAGRWAGAIAGTLAIASGPFVARGLVTPNFRTTTWFAVVVAGGVLVVAERALADRWDILAPVALLLGVFLGANMSSDMLLAAAGVTPLAATALLSLLLRRGGRTTVPLAMLGATAVALVTKVAVDRLMAHAGFHIVKLSLSLADVDTIPGNAYRWLQLVWVQGNGDFQSREFGLWWVIGILCAAMTLGGLVAALALAVLAGRRRLETARDVYLLYWGLVIVFLAGAYVFSSAGEMGRGWYQIVLIYAAPAVLPIVVHTRTRRLVVAGCAAVLIAANTVSIARGEFGIRGPVVGVEARVAQIAVWNSVTVAYADYWSSYSLSWGAHMRVDVYPVTECQSNGKRALCPFILNAVDAWYRPRSHVRSMLISQKGSLYVPHLPPPSLGRPMRTYRMGDYTVSVFDYDLASRLQ
jgi:hypothetical protein